MEKLFHSPAHGNQRAHEIIAGLNKPSAMAYIISSTRDAIGGRGY